MSSITSIYPKSNSVPDLPHFTTTNFKNHQQKKAYYLFNQGHTSLPDTPPKISDKNHRQNLQQPQVSQLQLFRNRYTKNRRFSQPQGKTEIIVEQPERQNQCVEEKIELQVVDGGRTMSKLFSASKSTNQKKDLKTLHNFLFKQKPKNCSLSRRIETDPKQLSVQFDDQQFRKSTSIILMRKLVKTKQKLARQTKQQKQFHQNQQIPIHHTQYHFNLNTSSKGKSKTQNINATSNLLERDSKSYEKTSRAIKDILKLQQAIKEQKQYEMKMEEDAALYSRALVHRFKVMQENQKRSTRDNYFYCRENNFKGSKQKMVNGKPVKPIRKVSTKEEEVDFGPWKRNISGDFQGFL